MDALGQNSDGQHASKTPIGMFSEDAFLQAIKPMSQWAVRYAESLDERDVSAAIEPGEILAKLPASPPVSGMGPEQWDEVVRDLEKVVEPGLVHWQSPRFFAYFPCGSSLPGVIGELVSAVMNVNGMLWSTSPAATEIEMRMMDWCASMFGLPDCFRFDAPKSVGGGCIQGTASEAVLAALVAARRQRVDLGQDRSKMCIYTSTQAHSSVIKAAMVAGLADGPEDRSRVRLVGVREDLSMDEEILERMIKEDIEAGLCPCLVTTTQGTTSTGAFDPLAKIGQMLAGLADEVRPWLHVDAAWAGAACVCPEHQDVLDGVEHADSLSVNPHKWLLTNFDCDLFWVRNRKALTDSMSITPAYLRDEQSESGEVVDYRDWHVPLGRRMRALKLWLVIRYFGVDGLQEHIRGHVELAKVFESYVIVHPRLELSVARSLSLVCFWVLGDDGRVDDVLTKVLIEKINARRRVMISHTVVEMPGAQGDASHRWIARVAIGSAGAGRKDIDELCHEIDLVLREVIQ